MNPYKQSRENAGLTQKEAAISLGVSVQAVSYWETGARLPSIDKLVQMADLYHVSTDYLLGRIPMTVEVKKETPPPLGEDEMQISFMLDDAPQDESELEDMIRREVVRAVSEELTKRGL
jgi:transcriptional regulator with XRE-family HTH domain